MGVSFVLLITKKSILQEDKGFGGVSKFPNWAFLVCYVCKLCLFHENLDLGVVNILSYQSRKGFFVDFMCGMARLLIEAEASIFIQIG